MSAAKAHPGEAEHRRGFRFFGRRLSGTPNLLAGWSFAALLAAYASALWREKAEALPIGIAYAGYVSANLFLFALRTTEAEGDVRLFGLAYTVIAIGVSSGAAALLWKHRGRFA